MQVQDDIYLNQVALIRGTFVQISNSPLSSQNLVPQGLKLRPRWYLERPQSDQRSDPPSIWSLVVGVQGFGTDLHSHQSVRGVVWVSLSL